MLYYFSKKIMKLLLVKVAFDISQLAISCMSL